MGKYEINCGSEVLSGLVEGFVRDTNFLLKEVEILEGIERILSKFISNSIKELDSESQRGDVWLSRFDAREKGQDAFYIQFSPAPEEEKVRFIQITIAEGRFLTKEIRFFEDCWKFPYIEEKVMSLLKKIFTKFGFRFLKRGRIFLLSYIFWFNGKMRCDNFKPRFFYFTLTRF